MPQKMSKEKEIEFQELSEFLDFYASYIDKIDPHEPFHPRNSLHEYVRMIGKSKALIGLRQAVNDNLEDSLHFDSKKLNQIDNELGKRGIPTLSYFRRKYWSKYKGILKRRMIKNETEYYLINGLLCGFDNKISEDEKSILSEMVSSYEERV